MKHGSLLDWATYLFRTPAAFTMGFLRPLDNWRLNELDCTHLPPAYRLAYAAEKAHRIAGESRGARAE